MATCLRGTNAVHALAQWETNSHDSYTMQAEVLIDIWRLSDQREMLEVDRVFIPS